MLQLAKDRNFSSDKTRKGAQGPFFRFFLAAVRALSSSTSKLRSAKEAFPFFLSLWAVWHGYDIKHGGCATAADMPAWIQHAFFLCLTLLAAVVDERRTVDLFSQFCHIVDDGNHRSTCTSGLFGLCFCIGGFAVDFLSALRPADIAYEPGKFLHKLLLRICDRPLPISVSDRSHPAFMEALSFFLTEKVPLHWIYFPLSNCRSPTETGMSGQSSLPTQWRRWQADKMHQASTLECGLVMVYLRSTLKKTHWLGHWTSRSQGRKKKQFDHISIDGGAPFFLRFQSDLRPGPPVMYRAACCEAQRDFAQCVVKLVYSFEGNRSFETSTWKYQGSSRPRLVFGRRWYRKRMGWVPNWKDVRAWRLFFMFLVQFFMKINAGVRKKQTNHQKINTVLHRGNAKCDGQEAFARGTIDDTIDEKQLIFN